MGSCNEERPRAPGNRSAGQQPGGSEPDEGRSLQIQKDLGDEHHYGFGEDPAAQDTVDNRMVVRSRDRDGKVRTSSAQQPARPHDEDPSPGTEGRTVPGREPGTQK